MILLMASIKKALWLCLTLLDHVTPACHIEKWHSLHVDDKRKYSIRCLKKGKSFLPGDAIKGCNEMKSYLGFPTSPKHQEKLINFFGDDYWVTPLRLKGQEYYHSSWFSCKPPGWCKWRKKPTKKSENMCPRYEKELGLKEQDCKKHDGYAVCMRPDCSKGTWGINKQGETCNTACSTHCAEEVYCDNMNGHCVHGCKPGYYPPMCIDKCQPGMFGQDCNQRCFQCQRPEECDAATGQCRGNCKPGWVGKLCGSKCPKNAYGLGCESTCSAHCAGNGLCNYVTGVCDHGCKEGYQLPNCDSMCPDFQYGNACSLRCSDNCAGLGHCDGLNGHCLDGCKPGYQPPMCKDPCKPGKYGKECRGVCGGHCASGEACNFINGVCKSGCELGFNPPLCQEKCPLQHFGQDCAYQCSRQCAGDGECDVANGTCTKGCNPGFTNEKCSQRCPQGYYGLDCEKKCFYCKKNSTSVRQCTHIRGLCLLGCEDEHVSTWCPEEIEVPLPLGFLPIAAIFFTMLAIVAGVMAGKRIRGADGVEGDMDATGHPVGPSKINGGDGSGLVSHSSDALKIHDEQSERGTGSSSASSALTDVS